MCILCGEMISSFHWSDVRFNEKNSLITAGQYSKERMYSRHKRIKILSKILEFYGLEIKDWQGSKYLLSNKKGRNIIINDLGDLWHKATLLQTIEFDALDMDLLRFLADKDA